MLLGWLLSGLALTDAIPQEQAKKWSQRIDNAIGLPTEDKRRAALVELLLEPNREQYTQEDARWNPAKAKFLDVAGRQAAGIGWQKLFARYDGAHACHSFSACPVAECDPELPCFVLASLVAYHCTPRIRA